MKKRKYDTRWTVGVALMSAVIVLLANTPLGMIQLPIIKATTVHIPVILGAIVLGPMAGSILGAVFGICSIVNATVAPALLSFAFSPFLSTTGLVGAVKAVWIALGCRILVGLVSGWMWIGLKKLKLNDMVALPLVGFLGSMCNTVFVMGSIYVLLAQQYAEARQVAMSAVYGLIMGTVTGVGVMEAIAALVLVTAIGKALLHTMGRMPAGRPAAQVR